MENKTVIIRCPYCKITSWFRYEHIMSHLIYRHDYPEHATIHVLIDRLKLLGGIEAKKISKAEIDLFVRRGYLT